ncbi:MAG: hypothetical protein ACI923_001138 [Flavobacteriales bacterium]|jgi:hypothetical protein
MKSILSLMALAAILFTSCDKIDQPVLDFNIQYRADLYGPAPSFGPAPTATINVLIEDFTAHQCGFCPDAGVTADEIIETYPGRVSVVAIHAGPLALTKDEEEDEGFTTDWTNADGDLLWDQLDFQVNPIGRINRIGGPGEIVNPNTWVAKTNELINQTAPVNLQLAVNYGTLGGHLNVHFNAQFPDSYENATKITVYITESGIQDWQLWYGEDPEYVEDYEFKHVLRGSVTGPLGLNFTTESVAANTEIQVDYSLVWNTDWAVENCSAIVLITDNVTGEVLNVIEAHL